MDHEWNHVYTENHVDAQTVYKDAHLMDVQKLTYDVLNSRTFIDCVFDQALHIYATSIKPSAFIRCTFDKQVIIQSIGFNNEIFEGCVFHAGFQWKPLIIDENPIEEHQISTLKHIIGDHIPNGAYENVCFTEDLIVEARCVDSSSFINCVFEKSVLLKLTEGGEGIFENCVFRQSVNCSSGRTTPVCPGTPPPEMVDESNDMHIYVMGVLAVGAQILSKLFK